MNRNAFLLFCFLIAIVTAAGLWAGYQVGFHDGRRGMIPVPVRTMELRTVEPQITYIEI